MANMEIQESGLWCMSQLFGQFRRTVNFAALLTGELQERYAADPVETLMQLAEKEELRPELFQDLTAVAENYAGPALLTGKKLKKAKFQLARDPEIWSGVFDADRFSFGSLKLPEGEAQDPMERLIERVEFLGLFKTAMEEYFKRFASDMLGAEAPAKMQALRTWAAERDAK